MSQERNQLSELKDINSKLDTLIRLTAIQVLGNKKKTECVQILTELGFKKGEIAYLLNTTPGSIDGMRHNLKEKDLQSRKTKDEGGKKAGSNKQENP